MITTKNLVTNYKEIDSRWIFEKYCNLKEKLRGQDIKIHSIFNSKDKTPSMCIYVDKNKDENVYKFKDFSTGLSGSAIDLVKYLKNYTFHQAVELVVGQYNDDVLSGRINTYDPNNVDDFKEHSKYQVTHHVIRGWNTKDQYLWTQYYIGSEFLNEYCVRPLEYYKMSKIQDGEVHEIIIRGDYIYGYFTKSGELYKIYQPKNKERKFIKVKQYIQGSDQLKGHDYLLITSGIKDTGSLKYLKLNLDMISPDSENTMIPKTQMKIYEKKYKKILVMFDNDEAGIKAMKKYREVYNTPCILLTMGKDAAESLKIHGPNKVKERLVPLINNQICGV